MKKSLLLIINPNSGKGKINKKIPKLVQNFEKIGYKINKVYTKPDYSACEIVEKYAQNTDLIVCCGGDGTLNEAINVMVKLNLKTKLSFIPLGTMNDFSKTLGISKRQLFSLRKDKDLKVVLTDIGKFNEKYFNYVAAFGAFTKVSYETPQKLKKIFGKVAYFMVAIKHLAKIKAYDMKVEYDNNKAEGKFIYGSISNSISIAGFKWFKKVDLELDDGKFEMILVRKPKNIVQFMKTLILMLRKKYKEPYFVYAQVSKVKIESEKEVEWTLDGEGGGKTKQVEIQNINKRIEYALPQNKKLEARNEKIINCNTNVL